jgi:hypothetical protein
VQYLYLLSKQDVKVHKKKIAVMSINLKKISLSKCDGNILKYKYIKNWNTKPMPIF